MTTVDDCGVAPLTIESRAVHNGGAIEQRDRDWIFAMADALGRDSGLHIPIVPDADALFRELRERLSSDARPLL